jgi:hypothetical protein
MAPNFGKYAILGPVTVELDQEPDWTWTFKAVDGGVELERSKFLLHNRVVEINGVRREQPPTYLEICHRELALTFGGTTIPKDVTEPVKDGGDPLIPEGANVQQVEAIIRSMPPALIRELWAKLGQSFPEWGPADPNAA